MKVSMVRVRAYFKKHMSLSGIKKKIAQKFGFRVKNEDKTSSRIPREVKPEDSQPTPKLIKYRKTDKADSPGLLADSRKQACNVLRIMLKSWMSGKPEEAVLSMIELYDVIDKIMALENHKAIAADDYANKVESIIRDLSESLSPWKKRKIISSLKPGGKIYRGLSALTFLQNGKNKDGILIRHSLSDKANACLPNICTLYANLFKEFHPDEAARLEERIMNDTDPERKGFSKREISDIKAAFSAMKKVK